MSKKDVTEYLVRWEIQLYAKSPEEAARKALKIHRDPESIATIFQVTPMKQLYVPDAEQVVTVDLDDLKPETET